MSKAPYSTAVVAVDTLLHVIKDKSDYYEVDRINAYTVGYLNSLLVEIYQHSPEARMIIEQRTAGAHRNLADLYEDA